MIRRTLAALFAPACFVWGACAHPPAAPVVSFDAPPRASEGATPSDVRGTASMVCGNATCTVPSQLCCGGEVPKCVAAPPPDDHALRYLDAVAKACGAKSVTELAGYAACDDTSDCESGKRCCEHSAGSGESGYVACATSCGVAEVCAGGATCSKPGTECVGGSCVKSLDARRCGSQSCSRDKPFCCGADQASAVCSNRAECSSEGVRSFECASSRDCVEGACQRTLFDPGTYCTLLVDIANAALVCETDSDCDESICMGAPGKGLCDLEEKACFCEST